MTTAAGASTAGSRDICSRPVKATPNTVIIIKAIRVVTLCLIQNLGMFILRHPSPDTIRTGSPLDR